MTTLLREVDSDVITGDTANPSNTPAAMKHEVTGIEGDMLLKIGDRFLDGTPVLGDIADADILV